MITVFALANGRSGTRFLCGQLRANVKDVVCRHETYFAKYNPSMFGIYIEHHMNGRTDLIREAVRRKKKGISRFNTSAYIETSHAFLKSYADVAVEFFPDMKLIHLTRHPMKTARSEANREMEAHRVRFPFRFYRGSDGQRHFRWALTGQEPIYCSFDPTELTLFQKYVVQWIEIENRAMRFLQRHDKQNDCFTLQSPRDIRDGDRIAAMLHFLGLKQVHPKVVIGGYRNRTLGRPTVIGSEEEQQFREVIERLPSEHLEVFKREPFINYDWAPLLQK